MAKTPKLAMRLKCWIANGPVAAPATRLTMKSATDPVAGALQEAERPGQADSARGVRGQTSASATSAAVAQNDISKPGCTTTSGSISRMISAASASERRLIACRSSRIAMNATEAVIAARRAGACAPDSTR